MKADVTLHRSPRADAFIIIAIALLVATAIALVVLRSPQPSEPSVTITAPRPILPPIAPQLPDANATADLSPPVAAPRPRRRAPAGIPLDAAATQQPDDYEILSAGELEAISQAPQ